MTAMKLDVAGGGNACCVEKQLMVLGMTYLQIDVVNGGWNNLDEELSPGNRPK